MNIGLSSADGHKDGEGARAHDKRLRLFLPVDETLEGHEALQYLKCLAVFQFLREGYL